MQESETPLPPEEPSGDQWDVLIKLYTELSVELHALSQPKIEPEKGTVPLRDENGNVKTNEPKEDADTANKKFVEEKISEFKTIISKQLEDKLDKNAIVSRRVTAYGAEALVKRELVPAGSTLTPVSIEELFVLMVKGENVR